MGSPTAVKASPSSTPPPNSADSAMRWAWPVSWYSSSSTTR
ncbi:hypothetical protein O976_08410 [Mycobacterium avium subsp. paratuberculosis 10-8425]|nr:hypothetical protein O976_08410 [Mycobacterium avium subsp. paratuberculosis 10-8425]